MPVQIPRLTRFNPQQDASVGRLDFKPVDTVKGQEIQTGAAINLVSTTKSFVEEQQKLSADTAAVNAQISYHNFLEDKLAGPDGAKNKRGDPGPIYRDFDTNAKSEYDRILDSYNDASDLTKQAVEAKLKDVQAKFYDRRTTAYGNQYSAFVKNSTEGEVKMVTSDVIDSISLLDPTDPQTTSQLDVHLNKLVDARFRQGEKDGRVIYVTDDEGKKVPKLDYSLQKEMAKDKSDALYAAIDTLNNKGDVEGATFLTERYGRYLDPVHKNNISEKTTKAKIERDALVAASSVMSLPDSDAMERLASDKKLTPEVREKAMAVLDSHQTHMRHARDKSSTENFLQAVKTTQEAMVSGRPMATLEDLYQNPVIKRIKDNITNPAQLKALEGLVKPPSVSTKEASLKMYDIITNPSKYGNGNGLKGMSPDEVLTHTAGLNTTDRNTLMNTYKNATSQTNAQEYQRTVRTSKALAQEFILNKYALPNDGGRYEGKDADNLIAGQKALTEAMANEPPMSADRERKFVSDFAAKYVHKTRDKTWGEFFGGIGEKFSGSRSQNKPTTMETPGVKTKAEPVDNAIFMKAIMEWKKRNNNREPDLSGQTRDYMELSELYNTIKKGSK